MLNALINKFKNANGRSEFVIAIVCDIRGFSSFSKKHEAPDIAMFCKRFYVKMLEEYFVDTDFAKPTGDGLLLLFKYSENNLHAVAASVLKSCLDVVRDFPTMMKNDAMINYSVPVEVGFGIARGTAFCLFSDDEVVDYSGQTLNLASRLNDFARPQGIVIDGAFMASVIPEELRSIFYTDMIFVRDIAEEYPREVLCSRDVVIPGEAKVPASKTILRTADHKVTVGFMKKMPENVTIKLPEEPLTSIPCTANVQWVHSTASWFQRNGPEYTQWRHLNFTEIEQTADGYFAHLRTNEILKIIDDMGLGAKAELTLRVQYVPATSGEPVRWISGD